MQAAPLRCPAHVVAMARHPLFRPGITTESPQAVVESLFLAVKSIYFYQKNINYDDLGDVDSDS